MANNGSAKANGPPMVALFTQLAKAPLFYVGFAGVYACPPARRWADPQDEISGFRIAAEPVIGPRFARTHMAFTPGQRRMGA
jgi:hypothetical protein